jgi:hypothetical protein
MGPHRQAFRHALPRSPNTPGRCTAQIPRSLDARRTLPWLVRMVRNAAQPASLMRLARWGLRTMVRTCKSSSWRYLDQASALGRTRRLPLHSVAVKEAPVLYRTGPESPLASARGCMVYVHARFCQPVTVCSVGHLHLANSIVCPAFQAQPLAWVQVRAHRGPACRALVAVVHRVLPKPHRAARHVPWGRASPSGRKPQRWAPSSHQPVSLSISRMHPGRVSILHVPAWSGLRARACSQVRTASSYRPVLTHADARQAHGSKQLGASSTARAVFARAVELALRSE